MPCAFRNIIIWCCAALGSKYTTIFILVIYIIIQAMHGTEEGEKKLLESIDEDGNTIAHQVFKVIL